MRLQIFELVQNHSLILHLKLVPLNQLLLKFVISLKNRIKNKVDQQHGFELFSRDCGSELIANGNQVISTSLDKGGDMNETGNRVADITIKINELRAKREQTSKTFESI